MNEKQFYEKLSTDLDAIKKLLVLMLKQKEVKGSLIAGALGISEGRLSQIFPQKKYRKRIKNDSPGG
jgi:DNA-directed RNA polymerase specialized sigma subunit